MKKIIDKFKELIRFAVTIFASREFAFIYCVLGVFAQIAHTYFLTNSISSFNGGFKIFQSVLLSAFISSSLLYFVVIVDNSDTKENKRNKLATLLFTIIDILINIYYYSRHLIIDSPQIQVFDFIFAIMISCLLPVTIKLYGGHIQAKGWTVNEIETKTNIDETIINNIIDKYLDEKLKHKNNEFMDLKIADIKDNLDKDVAKIFEKNQTLFLKQFENKCELILKSKSNNLS